MQKNVEKLENNTYVLIETRLMPGGIEYEITVKKKAAVVKLEFIGAGEPKDDSDGLELSL